MSRWALKARLWPVVVLEADEVERQAAAADQCDAPCGH
jgi:hypothetical protein